MSMDNYDDMEVVDDCTDCHTWLVEVCEPENVELVCPKLVLDMKTYITVLPFMEDEEDNNMMLEDENYCVSCYEEGLELDLFTMDIHDGASSRAAIIDKLCILCIPPQLHPSMADTILGGVFSEARRHNIGNSHKILHMEAMIHVYVVGSGMPDFDQGEPAFVPASQSSTEKLERARVETSTTTCSVCMEEIVVDSEATCMPCSHLYHEGCIVEWLQTSRVCPLCRFPMAATDE